MTKTLRATFKARKWRETFTEDLYAVWFLDGETISGEYYPEQTDATEMFGIWASIANKEYSDGLVPIIWFVKSTSSPGISELLPIQHNPFGPLMLDDFLTIYTGPIVADTGLPLRWTDLPVADIAWTVGQADKGGFIQEATGWKPSVLDPYVCLRVLQQAANPDCGDFVTHQEAQTFFEAAGGPHGDPNRLDGGSDGLACENLP